MKLATLDKPRPQPALFSQIEEAVDVMGSKALKIAVYSLESLPEVAFLISQNATQEGAFGKALTSFTTANARGVERSVMRPGVARELVLRWSAECGNLTYGIDREGMAKIAGLPSKYDSRLDGYCKAISEACEKAFGLVVGWYKGRFRVLTTKQHLEKETRNAKNNMEGGQRRLERMSAVAQTRAISSNRTLYLQAGLYENAVGEADELS